MKRFIFLEFLVCVLIAFTFSVQAFADGGSDCLSATADANSFTTSVAYGGTSSSGSSSSAYGGDPVANSTAVIEGGAVVTSNPSNATATITDGAISPSATAEQGDINITFPESRDLTTVNNKGHGYRGFAESGAVPIPGSPSYFGVATPGSSFQNVETIVIYKNVFTLDEIKGMAKSSFGSKVIVTPLVDEPAETSDTIQVIIGKDYKSKVAAARLLGYITVKATGDNTVSVEDLGDAMLAAQKIGANAVHVTAEGVERVMKAFGWGIGLSYTRATIADDETSGGVAAGGMGISGGSAKYLDRPWLQLFALKVAK